MAARALESLTSELLCISQHTLILTEYSTWGNSLSYLNANGNGGSSSPKILKDVFIPSNKEFSIFSSEKCDESCGYSRVPDVAYSMLPPPQPKHNTH
jgi:hypothetical protein